MRQSQKMISLLKSRSKLPPNEFIKLSLVKTWTCLCVTVLSRRDIELILPQRLGAVLITSSQTKLQVVLTSNPLGRARIQCYIFNICPWRLAAVYSRKNCLSHYIKPSMLKSSCQGKNCHVFFWGGGGNWTKVKKSMSSKQIALK